MWIFWSTKKIKFSTKNSIKIVETQPIPWNNLYHSKPKLPFSKNLNMFLDIPFPPFSSSFLFLKWWNYFRCLIFFKFSLSKMRNCFKSQDFSPTISLFKTIFSNLNSSFSLFKKKIDWEKITFYNTKNSIVKIHT